MKDWLARWFEQHVWCVVIFHFVGSHTLYYNYHAHMWVTSVARRSSVLVNREIVYKTGCEKFTYMYVLSLARPHYMISNATKEL